MATKSMVFRLSPWRPACPPIEDDGIDRQRECCDSRGQLICTSTYPPGLSSPDGLLTVDFREQGAEWRLSIVRIPDDHPIEVAAWEFGERQLAAIRALYAANTPAEHSRKRAAG